MKNKVNNLSKVEQYALHSVLLSLHKIFIEIKPIDGWSSWSYQILMEDLMSPFYVAYKPDNEFDSYDDALFDGLKYLEENGYLSN